MIRDPTVAPELRSHATDSEVDGVTYHRWLEQRRRIGISDVSYQKGGFYSEHERRKSDLMQFCRSNIKRKECIKFVPKKDSKWKPGEAIKCHCGEVPEKHIKGTAGVQEFFAKGVDVVGNDLNTGKMEEEWNKDSIRELPTNGFGKIDFIHEGLGGRKASKYVRLADSTPVDNVIDIILNYWFISKPHSANLVITVIGGAKNFKLDGKKKEVFNRGLVNAAQTTHAWIITSGCNMGVMKAVGEAVQEGQTYNWDKFGMTHTLRCIGIAPWGYVERKEALVTKDGQGCWNASYKVNNIILHGHPVSLNANHTHFFFVDDGYRGRYGGVADFRARLERKISLPCQAEPGHESGLGIPVVLVVVEGGTDAIVDVSRSLKQKIPVVLCEGTGRAADILAYANTRFVTTRKGERKINDKHKLILEDKLRAAYGKTWAERSDERKETEKYLKIVLECCEDEQLITVFDMNKHEDLDLAILSALLKGQGATNVAQLHDQLRLALTWNRSDVAEEKIFSENIVWPTGILDDIMTAALVENKCNFVKLLLQNGVIMKEYLTVPRLRHLYNSAPKVSHLRQLLARQTKYPTFTLKDVDKLLRKLLVKHHDDIYNSDNDIKAVMRDEDSYGGPYKSFPKPFRELFLWAVLMNRPELAKFLWERDDEAIPSAIAASRIYGALMNKVSHYESEIKESYERNKREFENLAVKVLDESNNTDPERAALLIEEKSPTWGGMSCLEMAATAQDKEFLSTTCCQNSLNIMWKRGIVSRNLTILAAILCPLLVVFLVHYEKLGPGQKLKPWQKMLIFYRAPVTKFITNVMMYLVFLGLYSYLILFDFKMTLTVTEWIVIGWMCTLLLEGVREMFFMSAADNVYDRLKDWWNFSNFNRIDVFILLLAILGFLLRIKPELFTTAKMVYCINCVFLFIRLLRDYSASSYLGPKLVMISKMMQELLLYIMILIVFLLAYGISSQALMYPTRDPYNLIFRDIFYYPYWQIYGELYLEELEGRTDECLDSANNTMADGTPCPTFNWLVPVLTAAYLLVGNVLLLNILIAIFNHVFEEIQTNSIQIWKFGMYFLVVEYDNKPGLTPPFIIFEHIFLLIRLIYRKTCGKKNKPVVQYTERHLELLRIFEKEMQRNCLVKQQLKAKDTVPQHVNKILNRVDEMAKMLEEERILEQQHFEAEQNKLGLSPIDGALDVPRSPRLVKADQMNLKAMVPGLDQDETDVNKAIKEKPEPREKLQANRADKSPEMSERNRIGALNLTSSGVECGHVSQSKSDDRNHGIDVQNAEIPEHDDQRLPRMRNRNQNSTNESQQSREPAHEPQQSTSWKTVDKLREVPENDSEDEDNVVLVSGSRSRYSVESRDNRDAEDLSYRPRRMGRKTKQHRRKAFERTYPEVYDESVLPGERLPFVNALESRNAHAQDDEQSARHLRDLDERLVHLENKTASSLYNIEALLRNAVFYRSPSRVGTPLPSISNFNTTH